MVKVGAGESGTIGGKRRKVAAGSALLLESRSIISPPTGSGAGTREPSTFLTKNSSNES